MENLTEREKLIIEFYENGKIPTIIAIYDLWKKEKINGIRYAYKLARNRISKLFNNGYYNPRTSGIDKKISIKRVENE